jgi:hypothetical protein
MESLLRDTFRIARTTACTRRWSQYPVGTLEIGELQSFINGRHIITFAVPSEEAIVIFPVRVSLAFKEVHTTCTHSFTSLHSEAMDADIFLKMSRWRLGILYGKSKRCMQHAMRESRAMTALIDKTCQDFSERNSLCDAHSSTNVLILTQSSPPTNAPLHYRRVNHHHSMVDISS